MLKHKYQLKHSATSPKVSVDYWDNIFFVHAKFAHHGQCKANTKYMAKFCMCGAVDLHDCSTLLSVQWMLYIESLHFSFNVTANIEYHIWTFDVSDILLLGSTINRPLWWFVVPSFFSNKYTFHYLSSRIEYPTSSNIRSQTNKSANCNWCNKVALQEYVCPNYIPISDIIMNTSIHLYPHNIC